MMSKLPPGFAYLLRALPAEFRARHRAAMQDLMASYTDAQSGWSRATMWLSAAVDILWVGLALRIQEARGPRTALEPLELGSAHSSASRPCGLMIPAV